MGMMREPNFVSIAEYLVSWKDSFLNSGYPGYKVDS